MKLQACKKDAVMATDAGNAIARDAVASDTGGNIQHIGDIYLTTDPIWIS